MRRRGTGDTATHPVSAAPSPARRAALAGGAVLVAATLALAVPGNPLFELRRASGLGMALSHTGVSLLALGAWPWIRRALDRPPRVARALLATVALPGAVFVAVAAAWPRYARQLLAREWGLIEPLQFVLYVVAASVSLDLARHRRGAPAACYRLGGVAAAVMALEEIDYLGLAAAVGRLVGIDRGRVGGVYVGSLHDLLNLATHHGGLGTTLAAVGALVAVLGGLWRWRRVLVAELTSPAAVPLLPAALCLALAQALDIDDRAVGRGTVGLGVLEEPLELLAVVCLVLALALKRAGARSRPATGEHAAPARGVRSCEGGAPR